MSATLERIMQLKNLNSQVGMNEAQRRSAQGDAMMQIGAQMGNPQIRGNGIDRMLNVLNASVSPAMQAYNASEQNALAQNREEMDMLRQLDKQDREEQRELKREARELAKLRKDEAYNNRYLDIMEGRDKNRLVSKGLETEDALENPETGEVYDLSKYPRINTPSARDRYIKDGDLLGSTVNKINHIEDLIQKYEEMHPDEFLNPKDPFIKKYYNEARDIVNRKFVNSDDEEKKERMKEFIIRKSLGSQLKQLNISAERAVTGRAMTQGMYDRLKDAYSDENEPIALTKERIQSIKDELMPSWKSNILSSTTGRAIHPNIAKDFPDSVVNSLQSVSIKNKKDDSFVDEYENRVEADDLTKEAMSWKEKYPELQNMEIPEIVQFLKRKKGIE